MLDLEWRPRAHLDRESIAIYLAVEQSSPQAALATMQKIDAAIERIRAFPESGKRFRVDGLEHRGYRTVLAGKFIVVYRHKKDKVTICRIIHQRRDIDAYSLVDL